MKRYRATLKFQDGSMQYVTVLAKDRDDAKHQIDRHQFRREERFDLTFARLEQARDSGEPGMLGVDPKFGGKALTEAWVKRETERRKRDQGRYGGKGYTVAKLEEVS